MSECSNPLPWLFLLRPDVVGKHPLTFEVVISDSGNSLTGIITNVVGGSPSDVTFIDGLCQVDPVNGRRVLSFRLSITINDNGTNVIKRLGVVGRVEVFTPLSKQFSGGYFAIPTAPGPGVTLAAVPDPGDTGTAGGQTGA